MRPQMQILARALSVVACLSLSASAQSTERRALARYYTAKELYLAGKFGPAAQGAREAIALLDGKSNKALHYLLVMSLYRNGEYKQAQKEAARFFDLVEGPDKGDWKAMASGTELRSGDEVDDITQILDKIDTNVANNTEEKTKLEAEKRLQQEKVDAEKRLQQEKIDQCKRNCNQFWGPVLAQFGLPHEDWQNYKNQLNECLANCN